MNEQKNKVEPPDLRYFHENWLKFPPEELAKYVGQHVAYSLDGKRIVASGEETEVVCRKLQEAGIELNQVVFGYVDPPEESPI